MKDTIYLLLLAILAQSCDKDDTDLTCISDCTLIQGQFLTAKGAPLKNVKVGVNYYRSQGIGSSIRRIKKTSTDKNGNFKMQFYVNDDELGNVPGYFQFVYDYNGLDPDVFIGTDYNSYGIGAIHSRDTIISLEFYNPKKAFITANLNGFNPIKPEDHYKLNSQIPAGLKIDNHNSWHSPYQIGSGTSFEASLVNTKLDKVIVAENDSNRIYVLKRINGELDIINDTVFYVPEDNDIELTFHY
ncbi:MAG: hypothetical protein AB3N10_07015 [Allomuricauda sp.]